MPRTSARPEPDGGLPYLEQKLGVFTRGPSIVRRNAALDILTGRVADASLKVATSGLHHLSRGPVQDVLYLTGSALPVVDWSTRLAASPWLAAGGEARPRFRIVPTSPPPRSVRLGTRSLAMVLAVALVLLGAGFELRILTDRAQAVEPVAAVVDAQRVEPIAALADVQTAEPIAAPDETSVAVAAAPDVSPPPVVASPPVPVPASEFGLLLDEGFTSNVRQWPSDPQGTAWLAGGAYRLVGRQATQFVAVGIPGAENLGDSVVTGWFRKVGGPDGGGYGLILRAQQPAALDGQNQVGHYYVFEVGDRAQVGLWLRDGDHWVDLLTWTASDAVRRGMASNELTVSAIGDHLSFLVNGVPVASQTDTLLHTGAAGVFVGGDGNEVALDRVAVRVQR